MIMRFKTLDIFSEPTQDIITQAKDLDQPILLPLKPYQDDRGWSLMNLFQGLHSFGQINFSHMHPGVIKAWHRHNCQTDLWVVVRGDLKIGIIEQIEEHQEGEPPSIDHKIWSIVLGEHNPGILVIPPGLWHGCAVLTPDPVDLLYVMDNRYNADEPDEQRRPYNHFGPLFSWEVEHK